MCGCGRKNWGAGACAAHYEYVCDVCAGADENPRTLKVWAYWVYIRQKKVEVAVFIYFYFMMPQSLVLCM